MKIECDLHLGIVEITADDFFEEWKNIPVTTWERLMDKLLSPSVRDKYFERDYSGPISKKRYLAGKKEYLSICNIYRIKPSVK